MSDIQAQSPAFVRETMLPPQPPPMRASGLVLWLRTNLFSGPLNIALTVLGLAIIWLILRTVWPWLHPKPGGGIAASSLTPTLRSATIAWTAARTGSSRNVICFRYFRSWSAPVARLRISL